VELPKDSSIVLESIGNVLYSKSNRKNPIWGGENHLIQASKRFLYFCLMQYEEVLDGYRNAIPVSAVDPKYTTNYKM